MASDQIGTITSLAVVLATFLGISLAQHNFNKQARKEAADAATAQSNRITALEVKIDVFWSGMMRDAANILHHPHPEYARRDELLEKLLADEISQVEIDELRGMLVDAIENPDLYDQGEKIAAAILLRLIDAVYVANHPVD